MSGSDTTGTYVVTYSFSRASHGAHLPTEVHYCTNSYQHRSQSQQLFTRGRVKGEEREDV